MNVDAYPKDALDDRAEHITQLCAVPAGTMVPQTWPR